MLAAQYAVFIMRSSPNIDSRWLIQPG